MVHATDANQDGKITRAELSRFLRSIDADAKLSDDELQDIFEDLGKVDTEMDELVIDIDYVETLILGNVHSTPQAQF